MRGVHVLSAAMAAAVAGPALAVTPAPAFTVGQFSQAKPAKGSPLKSFYYRNADVVRTTAPKTTPVYAIIKGRKVQVGTQTTPGSVVVTPGARLFTTIGVTSTAGSAAADWRYLAPLPAGWSELIGRQAATVTLDAVANTAPTRLGNGNWAQAFSGTLVVRRAAPVFTSGTFPQPRSNLLTVSFTQAMLVGTLGGTSAALASSGGRDQIVFSSDFMNFSNAEAFDWAASFSALSVPLSVASITNPNGYAVTGARSFNGWRANGVGTFAASSVPEPATWAMLIVGMGLVGGSARRRVRVAPVTVA